MPLTLPTYDLAQLTPLLSAFISLNDIRAQVLLTAPSGDRYKQQVFTLGLENLNQGIAAATPVGSRFLAMRNGLAVAADLTEPAANTAPKVASISSGTPVHQAIDAIPLIQRLPDVQNAAYELVTLQIPGVLTECYWVKLINGANHLFVPYLSLNKKLRLREPLPWPAFLQAIQPVAQKNLAFYATDMARVK